MFPSFDATRGRKANFTGFSIDFQKQKLVFRAEDQVLVFLLELRVIQKKISFTIEHGTEQKSTWKPAAYVIK